MANAVPLFNGLRHLPCPKETGGAQCTTVGCLFGHVADKQASRLQPETLDGATDDGGAGDGVNAHDEPPAKRQKISLGATGNEHDEQHIANILETSKTSDSKIGPSDLYDPFSPPTVIKQQADVTHPPSKAGLPLPARRGASQSQPSTPMKQHSFAATTSAKAVASKPTSAASVRVKGLPSAKTSSSPSRQLTTPILSSPVTSNGSPQASTSADATAKATPSSLSSALNRKPETLNPRLLKSAPATHGTRYKLLSMLHADLSRLNGEVSNRSIKDPQLKRLIMSDQELIWMALDREQELATQRAAIYTNLMKQDVMKYKRMTFDPWVAERTLALGKKAVPKNPSIGAPLVINTGLEPDQEAYVLTRLVTPITGLERHGYVVTAPTNDHIKEAKAAVDMSAGWEKCDRCTARFQVFPGRNIETGELASGGKCTHHPGRSYFPERQRGDTTHIPKKYRCCEEDIGDSPGCTVGQNHVWKTSDPKRLASLWNFVSTPANDGCVNKAVAFDCEMGYTVYGMELLRLTATSWPDGAEIIDVLVQPFGEILDLNSKYSGVFPEDMARAVPWSSGWKAPPQQPGERKILQMVSSPEVARDLLFSAISPETILVGHGLENDLNAMRMIHPRIVDTVLLYPHRRGLPIRMGLKVLMEMHLNRRIQVDTGEGHDSAEDARAAGDLVRLRVQKEWASMQSDGWKLVDGMFREPGWKPVTAKRESEEESVDREEGGAKLTEDFLEGKS